MCQQRRRSSEGRAGEGITTAVVKAKNALKEASLGGQEQLGTQAREGGPHQAGLGGVGGCEGA